jgi:nucleobase:cation symporter-1, NCS1 family
VFGAGLGVLIGLFYEIVNIALATMASWALLDHLGIKTTPVVEWASLIIVTLASFVISVFGHATILKLSPIFTTVLAVCFIGLATFVFGAADFSYSTEALPPADHFAMIMLGLVIVASNPISWGTGADYARYLPRNTSMRGVMFYTAAGSAIPAILITALGAIAGTAIDMTDPQISLVKIVPGWFYIVFLGLIVLSSVTNNVLVAYSTGLYFQELSPRIKRSYTVIITGAAAFGATTWLLFEAQSFIDTLNAALELGVTIMCPLITVYGLDIWLRKNRYDGLELNRTDPGSSFWYSGGIYWPGMLAMIIPTAVAVLAANTTLYVGPIAEALGGADLSSFIAPLLAATIYVTLWRNTHPYAKAELRPKA